MRRLALLALCACATTHTDKLDAQGEREGAVGEHRVVTEGPSLELEFAAPDALSLAPGPSDGSRLGIGLPVGGASTRVAATDNLPPHGALLKATFHGPSTDDLTRVAQTEAHGSVSDASASASTPKLPAIPLSCGLAGGVWIYIAVALALGGGGLGLTKLWAALRARMTRP